MMPASSRGIGMALGFPDVCNTPIPVGTVPIPYPNISEHSTASNTAFNVRVNMLDALTMMSMVPMTTGDEAGAAHPTIKGPQRYTLGMINVRFNMMPAITLCSLTNHNNMNCPIGAVLVPSAPNVLLNWAGADYVARESLDAITQGSVLEPSREGASNDVDSVHIALEVFAVATAAELAEQVHRATRAGARRVVLDLRACRGGVLTAAIDAAGLFLPAGALVVTIVDEDGDPREERSRSGVYQDVELVVLVGPDTASAAEVFAAALEDHGRATIVGGPTHGKGTITELLPAAAGLIERPCGFTVSPSGRPIQVPTESTSIVEAP
ncbi:MAG: S41 family peptidase [Polyangiaceae bacterium]